MRFRPILAPLSVALLSLGFLGHLPGITKSQLRHISSCGDAARDPVAPRSSVAPFPSDLFSYVQDDATRRWADAYSSYVRQMQLSANIMSFQAPSIFGFAVPAFPSYSLLGLDTYKIDLRKPDIALAWGGLGSNPALQYLVHPNAAAVTPQTVGNATSLNGFIDLARIPSSPTMQVHNNIVANKF